MVPRVFKGKILPVFFLSLKEETLPGQGIGALSGTGACFLWMIAIWFPANELNLTGISLIVAFLMMLISLTAVIASIKKHGRVLIFLFLISFFPVGLYLLMLPHWYRWIGVFNLGYLFAGVYIRLKSDHPNLDGNPDS